MKIETIIEWSDLDKEMNRRLSKLISDGNMIIDYGLFQNGGHKPEVGYIKYCDKQFLRDYNIKSIMNEL